MNVKFNIHNHIHFLLLVRFLLICLFVPVDQASALFCSKVYMAPARVERQWTNEIAMAQSQRDQKARGVPFENIVIQTEHVRPLLARMLQETAAVRSLDSLHESATQIIERQISGLLRRLEADPTFQVTQLELFELALGVAYLYSPNNSGFNNFLRTTVKQGAVRDVDLDLGRFAIPGTKELIASRPEVMVLTFENMSIAEINTLVAQGVWPVQLVTKSMNVDSALLDPASFFRHDIEHYYNFFSNLESRHLTGFISEPIGKDPSRSDPRGYHNLVTMRAWSQSLSPQNRALVEVLWFMISHELSFTVGSAKDMAAYMMSKYLTGPDPAIIFDAVRREEFRQADVTNFINRINNKSDLLGTVPNPHQVTSRQVEKIVLQMVKRLEQASRQR